jgi:GT2 family glycosyltransferase
VVPAAQEIVVVDNASSDDSLTQAARFTGRVRFIRNRHNLGFAAGVNQGFAATLSTYVLVLNPDVEATADAIEGLARFLDAHPRAGAVGGYVNERYLPRTLATPWTVIRENLGMPKRSPTIRGTEVEQAAAAALMVRRSAFDEIGGLDERFRPAWYEDVDFCRRLRAANWEIHYMPESRFVHEGGYTAKVLGPDAFAAAYYRNQLRYVRKHFGIVASAAVRGSLVAGMLGRIVAGPRRAAAYSKVIVGALGGW